MTLGAFGAGFLYGESPDGANMPTRRWYSVYSGYLPDVMSSVSQVEPWKSRIRNAGPTPAQLYSVLVA